LRLTSRWRPTVRFGAELGYEVTALDINIPNYASAVVTTDEIVGSISAHTRTTS